MGTGKVIGWGIEGVYWGAEGKEFTRGCMSNRPDVVFENT